MSSIARNTDMKKLSIFLLIATIAAPAIAAQPGPNKKALKTLEAAAPGGDIHCAVSFISFARATRTKAEKAAITDGLSVADVKKQNNIADAFDSRGRQWLNPNAKATDPLPKDVEDKSNDWAALILKFEKSAEDQATSRRGCDSWADIRPIDIEAAKNGN
jgi:hypothetical protein